MPLQSGISVAGIAGLVQHAGAGRTQVLHGTALNCRVVEVAFFQICDFLWEHDAPYHEMYQGTAAVRIYQRKQDTGRKSHLPRLGHASNVEWDLVLLLRRYAERHGLEVSAEYSKAEDPGARCRHCPPFFFTERPGERWGTKIREPVSRQMAGDVTSAWRVFKSGLT